MFIYITTSRFRKSTALFYKHFYDDTNNKIYVDVGNLFVP